MLSVLCSSDGESTVLRFITANKTSIPQFRVFFRNIIVENIKFSFRSYHTSDADDAEHIFWPIIVSSSLYATRVTRGQGVVLRQIGGRCHFRSRD